MPASLDITGLQGAADEPVIHLMILRTEQSAAHPPAEIRLLLTRLVPAQPFQIEPEITQIGEAMFQHLEIVTIQRNNERSLGSVIHIDPGAAPEFIGKGLPHTAAFHSKRQQRFFRMFGLRLGRQHAGSRPGGGHGRFAPVYYGDIAPRFRQAPPDTEPAYATANNDDHSLIPTVKMPTAP